MATDPKLKTSGTDDAQAQGTAKWQDKALDALKAAAGCIAAGMLSAAGAHLYHKAFGATFGSPATITPLRKVG